MYWTTDTTITKQQQTTCKLMHVHCNLFISNDDKDYNSTNKKFHIWNFQYEYWKR